jgi:predicted amidohydrolase YtcJ
MREAAFDEDERGSIEVGKLADFTVLSQDVFKIPPEDILNTVVMYTIIGGEVIKPFRSDFKLAKD